MVSEGCAKFLMEKFVPYKGTKIVVEYLYIKKIQPQELVLVYSFIDWNWGKVNLIGQRSKKRTLLTLLVLCSNQKKKILSNCWLSQWSLIKSKAREAKKFKQGKKIFVKVSKLF